MVDLNFAYHPSCTYDPRWSCPLAPEGNRLTAPVAAGEQLPPAAGTDRARREPAQLLGEGGRRS